MNRLILHLGSNLGDRKKTLEHAIEFISEHLGQIIKQSSFYETEAWLGPNPSLLSKEIREQAAFLNIALELEVTHAPLGVLDICMDIEQQLGRVRKEKWAARAIDIDLIFYGQEIIQTPRLILPHLWMQDRRFVLLPLSEIIPDWMHPVLGKNVQELLEVCEDEGAVERV